MTQLNASPQASNESKVLSLDRLDMLSHNLGQLARTGASDFETDELAWIEKSSFGDIPSFFASYGFQQGNEEDVQQARQPIQAFRSGEKDTASINAASPDASDNSAEAAINHTASAGSFFKPDELEWIDKSYGGIRNFLSSFELKDYNYEDLEEARQIIVTFKNDDVAFLVDSCFGIVELEWAQDNYGDTNLFMEHLGLKCDKTSDCRKANKIAGILMGKNEESVEGPLDSEGDHSDSDAEIDWDTGAPEHILADTYFDSDERKWVKKHYGDSLSFMFSVGLKFYDPDDGTEAQRIARSFMEN